MHVIGYLRVSTDEQARSGLGLDAQRTRIASEAAHRGWTVRWLVDEGYSAKNLHRPALTEALALLSTHEADALVVAKLDRLSRSVVDFSTTLATAKRQGWAMVLLDLGVDTATPNGKLVAGLMSQIAEWERELIGQRTREALAAAKARGTRLGRPRCTPDEVVTQVVMMRDHGMSLRVIAQTLTDASVPTTRGAAAWRPSTVRRVLNSHRLDLESVASHTGGA